MITRKEIETIAREDGIITSLEVDDLPPAGFQRINRTRPPRRPISAERRREDTRRPRREGKW